MYKHFKLIEGAEWCADWADIGLTVMEFTRPVQYQQFYGPVMDLDSKYFKWVTRGVGVHRERGETWNTTQHLAFSRSQLNTHVWAVQPTRDGRVNVWETMDLVYSSIRFRVGLGATPKFDEVAHVLDNLLTGVQLELPFMSEVQ